jgi:two-component system OmpR family response regulator
MARILVVDDDGHIREVVRFALEQAGHVVKEAADGAAALREASSGGFDLMILDIIMPEEDGLEVCRRIRGSGKLPIIFLSSRDEEIDRVLGLELGADDYITKPFSPRELVARVKAVLRRVDDAASVKRGPDAGAVLRHGPLVIDTARHLCTWSGREVVLTVTEFALLLALGKAPGRVFSRDELVDRAYGEGHFITERTVDSHIRRIRRKFEALGADPVETVYGVGYRMREAFR